MLIEHEPQLLIESHVLSLVHSRETVMPEKGSSGAEMNDRMNKSRMPEEKNECCIVLFVVRID